MRSAGDVIAQTTRALRSVALVGSRTARHTGLMSEHVEPAPSADRLAGLLPAVGDDRLGGPTLNERRTVGQLLQHIVGLTAAFRAAAEKDFGPWTTPVPTPTAGQSSRASRAVVRRAGSARPPKRPRTPGPSKRPWPAAAATPAGRRACDSDDTDNRGAGADAPAGTGVTDGSATPEAAPARR
jgi:hypothetical protein